MSKSISAPVAAKSIRAFFVENPNLIPEGDKSVGGSNHRGRISPKAREVAAAHGLVYAEKVAEAKTIVLPVVKVTKAGSKVKRPQTVTLAEFRRLSGTSKGRPSRSSLQAAAERWLAENA